MSADTATGPHTAPSKEKKGGWKKIDVDINFNDNSHHRHEKQKVEVSSSSPKTPAANNNPSGTPKKRDIKRNTSSNSNNGTNKSAKSSTSNGKHGSENSSKQQRSHNNEKSSKTSKKQQQKTNAMKNRQKRNRKNKKNQLKKAVHQIEYYFSPNELSRNTYLRRFMDVEGYVPASIVFNFPGVACWNLPYQDLIHAVAEKSSKLEVDTYNETLRIKDDFAKWLFPNMEGGFGCPRWYKMDMVSSPLAADETTTTEEVSADIEKTSNPSEDTVGSSSSSETVPDLAECSGSDSVSTDDANDCTSNDATSSDESAEGAPTKQ